MNTPIKRQNVIRLLLSTMLLITAQCVYARAGGGSSGGGSSSGGGGGIFSLLSGIIAVFATLFFRSQIRKKRQESDDIIVAAAAEDSLWNEGDMENLVREMFFKMQQAWMDRNLIPVRNNITASLYNAYKSQLDMMKASGEKNMLEQITVKEVSIVSSEDYKDNSKDVFIAYVKGNMIDYTINEGTGNITNNVNKESATFEDTYHFVRQGNRWLLNNIINGVTLSRINDMVNFREQ